MPDLNAIYPKATLSCFLQEPKGLLRSLYKVLRFGVNTCESCKEPSGYVTDVKKVGPFNILSGKKSKSRPGTV